MRTFAQGSKVRQQAIPAKSTVLGREDSLPSAGVNSIARLQRTIGNQALQRLLQANAEEFAAGSLGAAWTPLGRPSRRTRARFPAAGPPKARLPISRPGDGYEQEADRITEQVMRIAAPQLQRPPVPHQTAGRDERPPRDAIARSIRPLAHASRPRGATASDAVAGQIASSRGGGSPLPQGARRFMESRFGTDFSHVRLHTDGLAAQLSTGLNAKAFTVGRDIYLNTKHCSPGSSEGRHVLAHELTHTVQQGAAADGQVGAPLMIQKADGDKATTAFGEFEAVKYHALKQKTDGKEVGVEMFLKFKPGPNVDAKQIALTQAAKGKLGGTSAAALGPNYGRRSATSAVGQGVFIDRLEGFPNPLYPTGDKATAGADASKLTSYPTVPSTALTPAQVTAQEAASGQTGRTRDGWGRHGFRFRDAGGLKGPEAAELYDSPQLGTANDSEQIFESTALAIEGTQKDTYYGSVNWGWRRDTAGKFSILPLRRISQGTPSVNFLTAASIWNTATEDFNWGVSAAAADILDATDITKVKASVTRGTALTWGGAEGTAGGVTYRLVILKDGPHKGKSGLMNSAHMAMMDVGRQTVDLPVAEVYRSNAAGAWLVTNPAKAAATLLVKLAQDTRVTIAPGILVQAAALAAGVTIDPAWSFATVVDGPDINKKGWIRKTLLTREALGTR